MTPEDRPLAELVVQHSYLQRREGADAPFRLASGKTSYFYFDCQLTTMRAEAIPLIGEAFFRRLATEAKSVGGLTRGADPIGHAIAAHSVTKGRPVHAFSVRKEKKDHGTGKWIEGIALPGAKVAVVDDVITSGDSVIRAIDRCREEGLEVIQVLVLVDREQGGLEAIQSHVGTQVPVDALFRKSELDNVSEARRGAEPQAGGNRGAASGSR